MSNSHKETRRRPRVTSTSTSPDSLEAVGFLYLSVSVHQLISFVPRPHYRFLKCTVASALVTGSHTSLPGTLLPFRPTGISQEGERKERGDWITGVRAGSPLPQLFLPLSKKRAIRDSSSAGGIFPQPGGGGLQCKPSTGSPLKRPILKNSLALPQARPLTFLKRNCKLLSQQFCGLPSLA